MGSSLLFFRRAKYRQVRDITIDNAAEVDAIIEATLWADEDCRLRLHLPVELLVMQGAFSYASGAHPFLGALGEGPGALARFYRTFQPIDLSAMYGLVDPAPLPPWVLPWVGRPRRPPSAEGLSAEDGVSFYGPASPRKIDHEHDRLVKARDSIARSGYRPDLFGDITGHFLRRGGEFRFFVRGGKHRAAVLASLGWPRIPVQMKPGWPRIVDRADAPAWPFVRDGSLTAEAARAIFDRYFDPRPA